MKPTRKYLITALLLTASIHLFAQNDLVTNTSLTIQENKTGGETSEVVKINSRQNNFVKLNLTGLALKNYSLQFERTLNKKASAAIAFRLMPNTRLPFRTQLTKSADQSSVSTIDLINNIEVSNYAITPEVRIYLSRKGYGRGFYLAPFYRYASFSTSNIEVNYTGDTGEEKSLALSGKLNSNTIGMLFGAQWVLGKRVCLDWWIAGPHYGVAKGDFTGVSNTALSQTEQDELYRQIYNLEIPMTEKTVQVNANGANISIDGPWGGVRAGLSIGVKF